MRYVYFVGNHSTYKRLQKDFPKIPIRFSNFRYMRGFGKKQVVIIDAGSMSINEREEAKKWADYLYNYGATVCTLEGFSENAMRLVHDESA